MYSQIHEICFHGKGGYDWNTVYNMPRGTRLFVYNKLSKFYKDESEQYENAKSGKSKSVISSNGVVDRALAKEMNSQVNMYPKGDYVSKIKK